MFSEYEKMPKSFKKLSLSEKEYSGLNKVQWIVTEKVHGANFSFIYQDKQLKFAKRKDLLSWKDDFFGFQMVVNNIEDRIIQLFEQLSTDIEAGTYIIYGELFGGEYPHPDVEADKNVQAIQTGIYYSPSVAFYAFDIAIQPGDAESKYYLDYEDSLQYFEKYRLIHAKSLFIGKLSDAINFNIRINSTIPKQLNLPALEKNLIEGVVIKPLSMKSCKIVKSRPIIKLKNPEFDEEDQFHQANRWSYIPDVSSNSEDLSYIVDELRNYITVNRLNSAVSKIGPLDHANEQRINDIKEEFLTDVITDFNESYDKLLDELSGKQRKWVEDRIRVDIDILVRSV